MKTSIFRRGISGLLAVLMTFTALMGIGTTTAFAASTAGETAESYSVGFPRDGDVNLDYSGTWGHDELHYMNGWTSGEATWMTTLHTIGSFDGQACYCIEPGVGVNTGDQYTGRGFPVYWRKPIQDTARIIGRTTRPTATAPSTLTPSKPCWAGSCSTVIRAIFPPRGDRRMMRMPTNWHI